MSPGAIIKMDRVFPNHIARKKDKNKLKHINKMIMGWLAEMNNRRRLKNTVMTAAVIVN